MLQPRSPALCNARVQMPQLSRSPARAGTSTQAVPRQPSSSGRQAEQLNLTRHSLFRLSIISTLPALLPPAAHAGLDRYVKKRRLDPLVSYIPAIVVAQGQLEDVPAAADQYGLEAARALLREGAFVGIRDNIRAVGEYASDIIGKDASKARVSAFFRAIDELDTTLFLEIRKENPVVPNNLGDLVDRADAALNKVLEVVPEEDLDRGREIVAAIRSASPGLTDTDEGESQMELEAAKRLTNLL